MGTTIWVNRVPPLSGFRDATEARAQVDEQGSTRGSRIGGPARAEGARFHRGLEP
ncbi:MAG: hypothetical protein AMXMBFR53_12870 [Gemmatimonadota bacterium]